LTQAWLLVTARSAPKVGKVFRPLLIVSQRQKIL